MQATTKLRRLGRLCFMLMWLPFAIMMISMTTLPAGSYDWAELPLGARYSLVAIGVLAAGAMLGLLGSHVASSLSNRSVLKQGQLASAKITSIEHTGTTVNHNPVVRLKLEVQPPGQPAFQAETERLVSIIEIPQFQPGTVVHVKYDPATQAVAVLSAEDFEAATKPR